MFHLLLNVQKLRSGMQKIVLLARLHDVDTTAANGLPMRFCRLTYTEPRAKRHSCECMPTHMTEISAAAHAGGRDPFELEQANALAEHKKAAAWESNEVALLFRSNAPRASVLRQYE